MRRPAGAETRQRRADALLHAPDRARDRARAASRAPLRARGSATRPACGDALRTPCENQRQARARARTCGTRARASCRIVRAAEPRARAVAVARARAQTRACSRALTRTCSRALARRPTCQTRWVPRHASQRARTLGRPHVLGRSYTLVLRGSRSTARATRSRARTYPTSRTTLGRRPFLPSARRAPPLATCPRSRPTLSVARTLALARAPTRACAPLCARRDGGAGSASHARVVCRKARTKGDPWTGGVIRQFVQVRIFEQQGGCWGAKSTDR